MPRMKKARCVQGHPIVDGFCPEQHPPWGVDEISLTVEGFEAIRLCDYEGLDQQVAADKMEVSRPTLNRVLAEARSIVAEALVMGRRLKIQGGNFEIQKRQRGRRHFGGGGRRNR